MTVALGEGNLSIDSVGVRLQRRLAPDTGDDLFRPPRRRREVDAVNVVVEGQDDMLVSLARCCSPVPGDPIVGYVTVGRGVSVHRCHCTNVASLASRKERGIEVSWPADSMGAVVWIQVEALDRTRLPPGRDPGDLGHRANITASSTATSHDRWLPQVRGRAVRPEPLSRLLADIRGCRRGLRRIPPRQRPLRAVIIRQIPAWGHRHERGSPPPEPGGAALIVDARRRPPRRSAGTSPSSGSPWVPSCSPTAMSTTWAARLQSPGSRAPRHGSTRMTTSSPSTR